MFRDVSSIGLEGNTQLTPGSSTLLDDVYNSVSSSFRSLKETVVENPYTSAAVGLAATAGLLYLTRGKLWGVAAETEGSLFKLSSRCREWGKPLRGLNHGPTDAEALAKIRTAAQGNLKGGVSHIADLHPPRFNETALFKFDYPAFRARTFQDPDAFARIQAAAKGNLTGRPIALDASGRELTPFTKISFGPDIKKDTLTGAGANGTRIADSLLQKGSGTAAINDSVASAITAWLRKQ